MPRGFPQLNTSARKRRAKKAAKTRLQKAYAHRLEGRSLGSREAQMYLNPGSSLVAKMRASLKRSARRKYRKKSGVMRRKDLGKAIYEGVAEAAAKRVAPQVRQTVRRAINTKRHLANMKPVKHTPAVGVKVKVGGGRWESAKASRVG